MSLCCDLEPAVTTSHTAQEAGKSYTVLEMQCRNPACGRRWEERIEELPAQGGEDGG